MTRHRADLRPRWGRIGATLATCVVLVVALLATAGILRGSGRPERAHDPAADVAGAARRTTPPSTGTEQPAASTQPAASRPLTPLSRGARTPTSAPAVDTDRSLPSGSGAGRRAVFSIGRQRVWIVDAADHVARTYLVSGSVTDNLHPGTYSVYSRSTNAIGVDDSGTMRWFVRFAHGASAAIGFHDIPIKDGRPLQTLAELGTPQSHGCIRQKESDALAMWAFAQLGTEVVVTA
jgi:lipoprotein-anchoring transpeptidase ErfK/SrfK